MRFLINQSKRIHLLSDSEKNELYARPEFNAEERELYFSLAQNEYDLLQNYYSNTKTRVFFILQLGYFKAKYQFFKFKLDEVSLDVECANEDGSHTAPALTKISIVSSAKTVSKARSMLCLSAMSITT